MEKLLNFLAVKMIGIKDPKIEKSDEEGIEIYKLFVPQEMMGLVIGKAGKTIKVIRNLLKIRATLDRVRFRLEVETV